MGWTPSLLAASPPTKIRGRRRVLATLSSLLLSSFLFLDLFLLPFEMLSAFCCSCCYLLIVIEIVLSGFRVIASEAIIFESDTMFCFNISCFALRFLWEQWLQLLLKLGDFVLCVFTVKVDVCSYSFC